MKEIMEMMKTDRASSLEYKAKFKEERKLNICLQAKVDKLPDIIASLKEQFPLMSHTSMTQRLRSGERTSQAGPIRAL